MSIFLQFYISILSYFPPANMECGMMEAFSMGVGPPHAVVMAKHSSLTFV